MQDFSFLRLKPTFEAAKDIGDQRQSNNDVRYFDCIALHPEESYCQVTNSEVDIVFDNDYLVLIVDCAENELADITSKVTIHEFVNQVTGIQNIAFEIVNIGVSFYGKPVYLKIEHTTGTEIFYSNAFTISDENVQETFRLNYSCYEYYEGVDYENAPYFQSIRLRGQQEVTQDETEYSKYTQQNGNVVSKRAVQTFSEDWQFPKINQFTYKRLAVALKSDLVYIDGYRSTDLPLLKNGNRLGNSNLTDAEATIYRDFDEQFEDAFQITPVFSYVSLFPTGSINEALLTTKPIKIVFNKPVTIGTGFLRIFLENGTQIAILNELDFTLDNSTTVVSTDNLEDYVVIGNNYYVNVDSGLFLYEIGETFSTTNNTEWTFTTQAGDFLSTDFSSTDFLIYS